MDDLNMLRPTGAPKAPSEFSFRRSTPSDYDAVIRVLGERQGSNYLRAKTRLFDWQFSQNPHGDGRSPFVVGVAHDAILGVSGVMPVRLLYRGHPVLGAWNVDLAVARENRGKGFGAELLDRLSHEALVVMSYGISDMADPIFARYGWESNPGMKVFFLSVAEQGARGIAKNLRSFAARLRYAGRLPPWSSSSLEVHCQRGPFFGPEVDELWSRVASGYAKVAERDAAYLNWKYGHHPTLRYLALRATRHGRLEAILVVRHDPIESAIVDYCGPSEGSEVLGALLGRATNELIARGTRRIRCETTSAAVASALTHCGFVLWGHSRFRVWSNIEGDARSARAWFLMTGDSDNDLLHGC